LSAGAPARTGRGPFGAAVVGRGRGVSAFGFAAAFGFGFALVAGFGFAAALERSPPKRFARVAGRLPSTPASSFPPAAFGFARLAVFSLIRFPVYVSHRPIAGETNKNL
jgi:hypothetical protein